MKKKRFGKYLVALLASCLVLEMSTPAVYASTGLAGKTEAAAKSRSTNDVKNMYNLVVFARFNGDDEFINQRIQKADNITQMELVDNTYNKSVYSLKEYFKAVSNQTVDVNTVYLSASESELSSFVLDRTRGYYSPKTAQNPEGYTNQPEARRAELVNDWTGKVQEAFNQGIKPVTLDGTEIDYAKLDSNGDKVIDSITVLYPQADTRYSAEHGGPFWAYQWYTGNISVSSSAGILRSNSYFQTSLQNDTRAIYRDEDRQMYFSNAGTAIHEMGHVFGLKDLYPYSKLGYAIRPFIL